MTEKLLKIACTGSALAELDSFQPFQGELKRLPPAQYEALRDEMIERGFSFPLHVWENDGKLFLIDGHQRVVTLLRMREEGWQIPQLPLTEVLAKDYKEAKLKLLSAASQYGAVTEAGLSQFISDIGIDPLLLSSRFNFPDFDMPKFVEFQFPKIDDAGDIGLIPGAMVPVAAHERAVSASHVRMVQLFFNDELFAEFMEKVTAMQTRSGKENISDAVMEIVRENYQNHNSP